MKGLSKIFQIKLAVALDLASNDITQRQPNKAVTSSYIGQLMMLDVVGCSNNEKIDGASAIREVAWNDLSENQI